MTTPALRERLRYLLITDRHASSRPLERTVEAALEAGFTAVQLREKDLPARDLCDLALRLRAIADRWGALLIVNDRVDVALACGADGAQLGWKSLSLAEARAAARGRLRFGGSAADSSAGASLSASIAPSIA